MNDITKIAKSTAIYFVGNVLSKLMVFFLVPIYTKYIDAGAFGYYDAATAIVQFVQNLLFLDIGATILRYMLDITQNKSRAICAGLTIFGISLAFYVVASVFTGLFAPVEYVWYLALYGGLSILNICVSCICRGNGYNMYYAMSGVVATAINVALNIILIIVAKMDYSALYISSIASLSVQIILIEFKNRDYKHLTKLNFDKELFKDMFKYAAPLSVNAVAYWGMTSLNKIIISAMLGTEANGYLAIANKFTSAVYLISTCFQLAWQELAYSKENKLDSNTGEYYTKAFNLLLKLSMAGLALILPAISVFLKVFPSFIDMSYSTAVTLIPLAMAGAIVSIASSFLGSIYGGIKKTNIIFTSTLMGTIVNVGLVVGLIYAGVGIQAANIGFLLGFTVNTFMRTLFLKKFIKMKTHYWYFLIFIPIYIGLYYIFVKLAWYWNLIAFFVVFLFACLLMRKELNIILNSVKTKLLKNKEKIEPIQLSGNEGTSDIESVEKAASSEIDENIEYDDKPISTVDTDVNSTLHDD